MFAQRTSWKFLSEDIVKDFEILNEKKRVINLAESNPTKCGFRYPSRAILRGLSQKENLRYDPLPLGNLKAREAICGYYRAKKIKVNPSHIFLTSSTSESYSFLFRLLCNPGEAVLTPSPSYPLFESLGDLNDVTRRKYSLSYDGRWSIDREALAELNFSKAKALLVVHPNNPTGSFVKNDELTFINQLCRKNNLAVISDEVFLDYDFSKNSHRVKSLAGNRKVLTFTLGGISKSFGLPQMKLGWTVVSGPAKDVAEALKRLEIILDTYLSINAPVANALPEWFKTVYPLMQKEIYGRVFANLEFLKDTLSQHPQCDYLQVEGGWYAVIRLPQILSEDEWSREFLKKDNVFVHPGYFFDFEGGAHIVLSLLPQEKVFQKGIKRVFKRVKQLSC